jgi:hypothetical protein
LSRQIYKQIFNSKGTSSYCADTNSAGQQASCRYGKPFFFFHLKTDFFYHSTQYSLVERYQLFREVCCLHLDVQSEMIFMDSAGSPKTMAHIYQTYTIRHISNGFLHSHCSENCRSHFLRFCSICLRAGTRFGKFT